MSERGVDNMRQKCERRDFEVCPKLSCRQKALPVGPRDVCGKSKVKIFCPRCKDFYELRSDTQLDGAMFGTSFSHNFFAQLLRAAAELETPAAPGGPPTALMKLESPESSPKNIGSSVNKSQRMI
ncbi:GD15426 [Drosophila simulans]|uniref:GD15426 n=1 Tax=Drosophila simulans TaxID=7240 RepID=B4NSJ5_DROSI|nr:GD15426 [Drosophila simulans]